jgi:thermostable 8-oxoguanine DNA glycosylase
MNLTPEQLEAVRKGEALRFTDGGSEFVVLRADVYDKAKELLEDEEEKALERARLAASKKAAAAFMKDNPY